jgi:hypothetical protein
MKVWVTKIVLQGLIYHKEQVSHIQYDMLSIILHESTVHLLSPITGSIF